MPPIVAIVGSTSESGKTTLVEKLIGEMKSRGYQVATVKHAPQETDFDRPGTDSWRHIQAGSEATVVSGRNKLFLIKPASNATLDDVAALLGEDYDIILAEGFKSSDVPKIEVHRKGAGPLLTDLKRLMAIATDELLNVKTRQFSLDDVKGMADLLEEGFLKPQGERLSLYVDGAPITLTAFPKAFIASVVLGMVSSLKGVGKIKSLKLFFTRRD
ncbi:MAG: molybdopterin-guanine dinucleotide biosynthesis protein B [Chloroflexota bacterium]